MNQNTTYGIEPIEENTLLSQLGKDIFASSGISNVEDSIVEELPQAVSRDFAQMEVTLYTNVDWGLDEQFAIKRTLAGDLNAFNTLVLKHQRVAYCVAFRLLQSREAAADAVQESFLKAFRAMHSLRSDSFKSWLLRIVTNTCYDVLRQEREQCHDSIGDEVEGDDVPISHCVLTASVESPQAFVERRELRAHIELGLRTLPHEQRVVIVMHDIHGLSYGEISEITGVLMGTVKSRINRARQKLRTFLLDKSAILPIS